MARTVQWPLFNPFSDDADESLAREARDNISRYWTEQECVQAWPAKAAEMTRTVEWPLFDPFSDDAADSLARRARDNIRLAAASDTPDVRVVGGGQLSYM